MKNRIIILLIAFLFTTFLAGCDFFGTTPTLPTETSTTTTTTTTAGTDTTEETTTTPEGTTTATVTTTTPEDTTTTTVTTTTPIVTTTTVTTTTPTVTTTTVTTTTVTTTTPTVTTTTVTTTTPTVTTTTVTTTVPTTTTTTTPVTTYSVSFFNADGSLLVTRILASGSAATAPADPTLPSTAQYAYTFSGWDKTFSNVTSNLSVYATYTTTVRQYEVTFYDEDGVTVLQTGLIPYGSSATAPSAPGKIGKSFYGWIGDYSFITGTTTLTAIYQLNELVDFVRSTFGEYEPSQEEMDERMAFIHDLFAEETDPEILDLLQAALTLKDSFTVETLTTFTAWYENAKLLGFTRSRMINLAINFLQNKIDAEVDAFDPAYDDGQVAFWQAEIAARQQLMTDLIAQASTYCTSLDQAYRQGCQAFMDHQTSNFHQEQEFYDLYDQIVFQQKKDKWDSFTWNQIMYSMDQILYFTHVEQNPDQILYFQGQLESLLSMQTQEDRGMYETLVNAYLNWQTYYYTYIYNQQDVQGDWQDASFRNIIDVLFNDFIYPYRGAFYELDYKQWMLQEAEWKRDENLANHEMFLAIQTYLNDPANLLKVRTLVGTVYDVIDSVVLGVDEATFNLIKGLADGTITPQSLGMTAADFADYAAKVANLLTILGSTIHEDDILNLHSLAVDILTLYINSGDFSEEQRTILLANLSPTLEQWLAEVGFAYQEVIDLLEMMTTEKVQIIMDQVAILMSGSIIVTPTVTGTTEGGSKMGFGIEKAIAVAILIDEVLYGGEFDLVTMAGFVVEGYFDVKFMFGDDAGMAISKALLQGKVSEMIALAHDIRDYDPSFLTADQIENLDLFQGGAQWILQGFQLGFEYLPDLEMIGYSHEKFLSIVFNMFGKIQSEEQAEEIILMITDAFGLDEEHTYYQLLAIAQFIPSLSSVRSLADFQEWYGKLAVLGYPKEVIASIGVDFLVEFLDYQIANGGMEDNIQSLIDQIIFAEDQIAILTQSLADNETAILDILAITESQIANIPNETVRGLCTTAWNLALVQNDYEINVQMVYNQVHQDNVMSWQWWDDQNINNLINYQGEAENYYHSPIPYPAGEGAQAQYDALWAVLSTPQQLMYQPILDASLARFHHRFTVFFPAIDAIAAATFPEMPLIGQIFMGSAQILDLRFDNLGLANQIDSMTDNLVWLHQDLDGMIQKREQLLALQTYFTDPDHVQLVKDVALIAFTEFEYLLANIDEDSVNLVLGIVTGSINPATLDLTALGILGYTEQVSAFLKLFFTTLDETDEAKVIELIQDMMALQIYIRTDLDLQQKADLVALWNAGIVYYYGAGTDALDVVTLFLDNLTEAEIQTVMDQIGIITGLTGIDPDADNMVRAVAIANIVLAAAKDGNLDTDFIIETGIQGYFDFRYDFSFGDQLYIDGKILEIQTLIDAIILQADVIDGYDPLALLPGERDEINNFHFLIEDLIEFVNYGPDPIV